MSDKFKELMSIGVKNILVDSSASVYQKHIKEIDSFISLESKKSIKYYCSRVKSKTEICGIISLSNSKNNFYFKDAIYNTQYGAAEIFDRVNEIGKSGFSTIFMMPNGEWTFPYAKYDNWVYDDGAIRSMSDAIFKVSADYDLAIGIGLHVKSAQENFAEICSLCNKLLINKVLLIDAIYLDDSELISMYKRFLSNNIEIYFEGMPRFVFKGLLSHSYCAGKWLWLTENRGKMPDYLDGLVQAI
jgi:hypothetical protein